MIRSEGKRPLGRPRRGWVDNIHMDVKVIDGVVRIGLIWLEIAVEGSCEHGNEPSDSIKCWEVLD